MENAETLSIYQLRRIGFGPDSEFYVVKRLQVGVPVTIGRRAKKDVDSNKIVVTSPHVSREHCKITVLTDGRVTLVDTSQNGTFVNGSLVKQAETELRANDQLSLGQLSSPESALDPTCIMFKFEVTGSLNSTKQEPATDDDAQSLEIDTASQRSIKSEAKKEPPEVGKQEPDEVEYVIEVEEDEEYLLSQQHYKSIKEEANDDYGLVFGNMADYEDQVIELLDSDEEDELTKMRRLHELSDDKVQSSIQQIPEPDFYENGAMSPQIQPSLDTSYLNELSQLPPVPSTNGYSNTQEMVFDLCIQGPSTCADDNQAPPATKPLDTKTPVTNNGNDTMTSGLSPSYLELFSQLPAVEQSNTPQYNSTQQLAMDLCTQIPNNVPESSNSNTAVENRIPTETELSDQFEKCLKNFKSSKKIIAAVVKAYFDAIKENDQPKNAASGGEVSDADSDIIWLGPAEVKATLKPMKMPVVKIEKLDPKYLEQENGQVAPMVTIPDVNMQREEEREEGEVTDYYCEEPSVDTRVTIRIKRHGSTSPDKKKKKKKDKKRRRSSVDPIDRDKQKMSKKQRKQLDSSSDDEKTDDKNRSRKDRSKTEDRPKSRHDHESNSRIEDRDLSRTEDKSPDEEDPIQPKPKNILFNRGPKERRSHTSEEIVRPSIKDPVASASNSSKKPYSFEKTNPQKVSGFKRPLSSFKIPKKNANNTPQSKQTPFEYSFNETSRRSLNMEEEPECPQPSSKPSNTSAVDEDIWDEDDSGPSVPAINHSVPQTTPQPVPQPVRQKSPPASNSFTSKTVNHHQISKPQNNNSHSNISKNNDPDDDIWEEDDLPAASPLTRRTSTTNSDTSSKFNSVSPKNIDSRRSSSYEKHFSSTPIVQNRSNDYSNNSNTRFSKAKTPMRQASPPKSVPRNTSNDDDEIWEEDDLSSGPSNSTNDQTHSFKAQSTSKPPLSSSSNNNSTNYPDPKPLSSNFSFESTATALSHPKIASLVKTNSANEGLLRMAGYYNDAAPTPVPAPTQQNGMRERSDSTNSVAESLDSMPTPPTQELFTRRPKTNTYQANNVEAGSYQVPSNPYLTNVISPPSNPRVTNAVNPSNPHVTNVTNQANPYVTNAINGSNPYVTNAINGSNAIRSVPAPVPPPNPAHLIDRICIIKDILCWQTKWFETNDRNPPINGNCVLQAMKQEFDSYTDYVNTLAPLFKLELYESLRNSFHHSSRRKNPYLKVFSKTKDFHFVVLNCGLSLSDYRKFDPIDQIRFRAGYLVMIIFNEHSQLAYIQEADDLRSKPSVDGFIHLKLATNSTLYVEQLKEEAVITLRPIDNIKHELDVFDSIHTLQKSPLRDKILKPKTESNPPVQLPGNTDYNGLDRLNQEQYDAILDISKRITFMDTNIFLVNGPPGTGKTRLIANFVVHMVKKKKRILLCAPSNAAVDVLALKLINLRSKLHPDAKFQLVRCGAQDRIDKNVAEYHPEKAASLQQLRKIKKIVNEMSEDLSLMRERRKSLDELREILQSFVTLNSEEKVKQQAKQRLVEQKIKDVEQQIYQTRHPEIDLNREKFSFQQFIIQNASVVCTTLGSLSNIMHQIGKFDICIIDEATLSNEYLTLAPLKTGVKHLMLVGDTKQMPPHVSNVQAKQLKLDQSLFARIESCNNENSIYRLKKQFRMHPAILDFPNGQFYRGHIDTSSTVMNYREKLKVPFKPYLIFELESTQNMTQNPHVYNTGETMFIAQMVSAVQNIARSARYVDVQQCSIGVITPYVRQREELMKQLGPLRNVTISTIDSIQGKEMDIVIISCARTEGVGFMSLEQRLNVALTRAKYALYICGNFISLLNNPVWQALVRNAKQRQLFISTDSEDVHTVEGIERILRSDSLPSN